MNSDNETQFPILLAAGGTGGHMFPAFALAAVLQARGKRVIMVTDGRGETYKPLYPNIEFFSATSETFRPGLLAKVRLVARLFTGIGQAYRIMKRERPACVVGFGGYSAAPAMVAALALGVPVIVHEQNAVLGMANKIAAFWAKKIALSLPTVANLPQSYQSKAVVTGNPVRADIEAIGQDPYVPPAPDGPLRILVMGGSQAAKVFSTHLPAAIKLLPEDMRKRLDIVQQCRASDLGQVQHHYEVMGIKANLKTFIPDVPTRLRACHLVIARGGASTVAEVAIAGRPAFFVPYPYHKDQQQKVNAAVLATAGAGVILEEPGLTVQIFAKELEKHLADPALLARMAKNAGAVLQPHAAERLADVVCAAA